jgi:Asp-tRNA(Asn)/Glu-tRNA(Gln) amidotransferase A subunit family amidase
MTNTGSLLGLRIGVFHEHINDADDIVIKATQNAIAYYKSKSAHIIPITLPHLQEIPHLAHGVTLQSLLKCFHSGEALSF